ncbi:MAG: TrkH family potassium uptake protein [Acutalibacteraceae bacterium]|nr:TrkH family potassium uptake protein [Acutalibacteraceae bacterium]
MNRRMVLNLTGKMIMVEAVLLLLPLSVAIIYQDKSIFPFIITIAIALVIGSACTLISKPDNHTIYAKEGFVIVAIVWLAMSAIGALPFYISGEIPSYIDCFFETVSGFTTTGASILTDIESLSKGLLFWRSFTHWIGGMGVLVFVLAIIPGTSDRSIHLLRAEVPGPIVGKLVPKIKETAKILYLIYIVMTVVEIIFLLLGGMPLYDSTVHAFGTAGTGGFGIKADSIAGYNPYLQWVIAIFMLLFALNFNIFYLAITRHFKAIFKSGELWGFITVVAISITVITCNIYPMYENFSTALRNAAFQTSSIISTTGYATADFNLWPGLSKAILFLLMFFGGCAGSTAGGLKMSRIIIMVKMIKREFLHMLHPRSVGVIKFEGKKVENSTLNSVANYFALYMMLFVIIFLILSFEPFDFETNITATAACFNNVGPGLSAVGPASNYSAYTGISKFVLSIAMLLGRLEIYPILIALSPSTWAKK